MLLHQEDISKQHTTRRDTSIILEGREKLGMGNHTNKGIKCRRGTDSGEGMLKGALSSNPVSKLK